MAVNTAECRVLRSCHVFHCVLAPSFTWMSKPASPEVLSSPLQRSSNHPRFVTPASGSRLETGGTVSMRTVKWDGSETFPAQSLDERWKYQIPSSRGGRVRLLSATYFAVEGRMGDSAWWSRIQ